MPIRFSINPFSGNNSYSCIKATGAVAGFAGLLSIVFLIWLIYSIMLLYRVFQIKKQKAQNELMYINTPEYTKEGTESDNVFKEKKGIVEVINENRATYIFFPIFVIIVTVFIFRHSPPINIKDLIINGLTLIIFIGFFVVAPIAVILQIIKSKPIYNKNHNNNRRISIIRRYPLRHRTGFGDGLKTPETPAFLRTHLYKNQLFLESRRKM